MAKTRGCEPLRVWNRLEPRPRRADFTTSLRAEIHDPLWLLARQWQFGEFRGEDTGSPIFARIAMRNAPITEVGNQRGFMPRSDALPLEAWVERDAAPDDLARAAQLGRRWLTILDHHGSAFDAGGGSPSYDSRAYRARYLARFPCTAPAITGTGPDAALARARELANPRRSQLARTLAARALDGAALASALPPGVLAWSTLPASITADVPVPHRDFVLAALEAFRAWCAELATTPEAADDRAWNAGRLEYQLACRVPRPGGGTLELRADQHDGGELDWHAFELGSVHGGGGGDSPALATTTLTVVPSLAEFPGQPHPRYWQFEDGTVDVGNVRADTTDLAKIIVAEFALVYGNNWFVMPCDVRAGTLAEIEGIVVADVFGQRTLVRSATRGAGSAWTRWSLFELTPATGASPLPGPHLFVPPTLASTIDGPRIETVRFARDEMANTVWAIEARISDGLGGSRDGHDTARRVADAIRAQEPAVLPAPAAAALRYTVGSSVPDNWIPFVPVHAPAEDRAIRLQRASMPRFFQGSIRPVRPTTQILRGGLAPDDVQLSPYYVDEEEVPRAGVEVASGFQRARWLDGSTVVWFGKRRRTGRGAGSSGLRFDIVDDAEPSR